MRRWRFGFLSMLVTGLFTLGAMGVAQAAGPVKLKTVVIHATKKPGKPHPGLKNIQKSLQKTFGQFKGFTLVSKEVLKLEKGKAAKLKLPKNRSALITYKGTKKKQHKLRLSVPKSKVNIDLSVKPRKMFYQAGLKHDGGILILGLYIKD